MMSDRKAAYIATIDKKELIPGKDRIAYYSLVELGWKVIADISLNEGDRVIYCEYDCIISEDQLWAEFLRKRCYSPKYRGYKISAMKMGDFISYGIIFKPEECGITIGQRQDGEDLSEILHIYPKNDASEFDTQQKQTPPSKWQRFLKKYAYFIWKFFWYRKPDSKQFPSFMANKTDETRIENFSSHVFEEWYGKPIYVTEKADGQSMTAGIYKNRFIISSRNIKKYDKPLKKAIKEIKPENAKFLGKSDLFIEFACNSSLGKKLFKIKKEFNLENFAIQLELCGPSIQKNHLGLKGYDGFVFNIYNSDEKKYYKWEYVETFCNFVGIKTVKLLEITIWKWKNLKELKNYSKGFYENGYPREGVVIRSNDSYTKFIEDPEKGQHGCWSIKCINDDFALKDK
jgi:hypothetical protein